ncbi:hypothetical protein E4G67_00495 [Candidatus Bathyarchaeota archaeon]|nr:MAG: hypothetical protein E4G67_00495 [Candidatus Bathyarchaeota archaeon]
MAIELKDEIEKWRKKLGLDQLLPYDTGEIQWALNIGKEINYLDANKVGEVMIVLSNLLFTVSEQMGMVFARVRYLENHNGNRDDLALQRAKLNIVKPFHDAIDSKIAVVKKIYDFKVKEYLNAPSSGR